MVVQLPSLCLRSSSDQTPTQEKSWEPYGTGIQLSSGEKGGQTLVRGPSRPPYGSPQLVLHMLEKAG